MTEVSAEVEPTALASSLRVFADALRELGADWEGILRACAIEPASMLDPEARVPQSQFDRVWVTAAERTGDPCIGLHAGERAHPRAVNVFGYLALSSATLSEGLARVARYQRLVWGRDFISLRDDAGIAYIELAAGEPSEDARAIRAEYTSLLVLAFLAWVADRPVLPLEVSFAHAARGPLDDYARALRCPVKFDAARAEMIFPKSALDLPSAHANPSLAQLTDAFAARLLAELPTGGTVAHTRRALAALLDSGEGDVRRVSRRLGMSARTLQRRLAEEGQSFRGVLDSLRRELAEEHLRQRRASIAETAHLTGFSEVSAFARAVRRWFGCTPRELRELREKPVVEPGSD
jgi:AraC-like DNA-binding protein